VTAVCLPAAPLGFAWSIASHKQLASALRSGCRSPMVKV
jgi:hypothetical protein